MNICSIWVALPVPPAEHPAEWPRLYSLKTQDPTSRSSRLPTYFHDFPISQPQLGNLASRVLSEHCPASRRWSVTSRWRQWTPGASLRCSSDGARNWTSPRTMQRLAVLYCGDATGSRIVSEPVFFALGFHV